VDSKFHLVGIRLGSCCISNLPCTHIPDFLNVSRRIRSPNSGLFGSRVRPPTERPEHPRILASLRCKDRNGRTTPPLNELELRIARYRFVSDCFRANVRKKRLCYKQLQGVVLLSTILPFINHSHNGMTPRRQPKIFQVVSRDLIRQKLIPHIFCMVFNWCEWRYSIYS
jgi:hypothetical protein